MQKILAFLEGKRTYLVGVLIALWGLVRAIRPGAFPEVDPGAVDAVLGILVIIARSLASKPGALVKGSAE